MEEAMTLVKIHRKFEEYDMLKCNVSKVSAAEDKKSKMS